MDAFKLWLVNVGLKKMGPSLIRAAVAWAVAVVAAHQGMLTTFGVIYDASAHTLTLHIDTLQGWMLGGGLGLITAFLTAAQHHTTAVVTGASQQRATDAPQGESK
jgi:hypothetical protein